MNPSRTTTVLFALLALAIASFSSCNPDSVNDVDPSEVYSEYELYYNANEGKSFAVATFKSGSIGGTRIELPTGAEVSFNGDILTWNSDFFYYEKEYVGIVNLGEFLFVDADGVSYENTATLTSIDRPAGFDSLALLSAYVLEWVGTPLEALEDVTVYVNGVIEGDVQTFYTNTEGTRSIILDRNRLIQLGEGPGTVWMDRRTFGPHSGTDAGGYVVGRFRGVNATPLLY